MLVTGEGAHQKDVGLVVAVLGEVNALGFFLDLVGPAILGGEGEAVGQLDHRTHLQADVAAVGSDFLETILIRDLYGSLEHCVGQHRLRQLCLGELLGQVAIGANNFAGGFAWGVVVLLSPEGIGPAAGGSREHGNANNQSGE